MIVRRTLLLPLVAAALVLGPALPAPAQGDAIQTKSIEGPGGRHGTVKRYAERRGDGRTVHSVTMTADDADGRGGRCTETWVDYRTKPHQHLNPGLLVNCSGDRRSVAGAVATEYDGVAGMSVIVCEVPDTSGRIRRDESNCRGGLGAMSLRSNLRYDDFRVDAGADRAPGGVRIWRI
jgi:hypothetical protein